MGKLIVLVLAATAALGQTTMGSRTAASGSVHDYSGAGKIIVRRGTAAPSSGDCDAAGEVGSVYLQGGDPAAVPTKLWVCRQTGSSAYAWGAAAHTIGTAAPATCAAGDIFFDTDATAGENLYGCTATNTWSQLGGTSTGLVNQSLSFSSSATQTLTGSTHGYGTSNLVVTCYDTTVSPAKRAFPEAIEVDQSTYDVTVTFPTPWTGKCVVNGSGGAGGGGGGGTLTTLNGQTGATQTFANDTNVTVVSSSNTHTIAWAGQLGISRGGTGSSSAAAARVNLMPSLSGNGGSCLKVNAGATDFEYGSCGGSLTASTGIEISASTISVDALVIPGRSAWVSVAYDFPSIATGAYGSHDFTGIPGVALQDKVLVSSTETIPAGVLAFAQVIAADAGSGGTIRLTLFNISGSAWDPGFDTEFGFGVLRSLE